MQRATVSLLSLVLLCSVAAPAMAQQFATVNWGDTREEVATALGAPRGADTEGDVVVEKRGKKMFPEKIEVVFWFFYRNGGLVAGRWHSNVDLRPIRYNGSEDVADIQCVALHDKIYDLLARKHGPRRAHLSRRSVSGATETIANDFGTATCRKIREQDAVVWRDWKKADGTFIRFLARPDALSGVLFEVSYSSTPGTRDLAEHPTTLPVKSAPQKPTRSKSPAGEEKITFF